MAAPSEKTRFKKGKSGNPRGRPRGASLATRCRLYFDRPALLAWAVEDRFFKVSFAEKLAATINGARLERIDDSYTFVSEDQPERLAELISSEASAGA